MKKLALLFVVALAFAACTTDDTADVPEGMLSKIVVLPFVAENGYTARYHYKGHKIDRIEKTNDTRDIFYYDGDYIVNIKSYDDTTLADEQLFQYDSAGRLVQYESVEYLTDWHSKSTYAYNLDGSVTASHCRFYEGEPETFVGTTQVFFANNEVSQQIFTATTGETQTISYTYDDKLVPEHDITGLDKIRMFFPNRYRGVYHNIVTVSQTNSINSEVATYSHVWSYNEAGAPTAFSFDDQGTIIIDGGSQQFFYK